MRHFLLCASLLCLPLGLSLSAEARAQAGSPANAGAALLLEIERENLPGQLVAPALLIEYGEGLAGGLSQATLKGAAVRIRGGSGDAVVKALFHFTRGEPGSISLGVAQPRPAPEGAKARLFYEIETHQLSAYRKRFPDFTPAHFYHIDHGQRVAVDPTRNALIVEDWNARSPNHPALSESETTLPLDGSRAPIARAGAFVIFARYLTGSP